MFLFLIYSLLIILTLKIFSVFSVFLGLNMSIQIFSEVTQIHMKSLRADLVAILNKTIIVLDFCLFPMIVGHKIQKWTLKGKRKLKSYIDKCLWLSCLRGSAFPCLIWLDRLIELKAAKTGTMNIAGFLHQRFQAIFFCHSIFSLTHENKILIYAIVLLVCITTCLFVSLYLNTMILVRKCKAF